MHGRHKATLAFEFTSLLELLANDLELPQKMQDHALTGQWSDHRDCHLKPDLVLINRKPDGLQIDLVRLGSHSELKL